ncbi:MAG TPA: S46 family peptidase [Terriglobia bacterium]|nr:S46 family peptidase [Terriglobia bacterium]
MKNDCLWIRLRARTARCGKPLASAVALAAIWTALFVAPLTPRADEGMWTFDNPPRKLLQERYSFTPTQEWLDHVRLASVRFNDGGSGSFVSPHGLVLTNHHVAFGQLQKVSTPQKDYVKDGFYAKTAAEELKCPDLELNVLMSMEDVTARVQGVVKPGMSDKDALDARKAEIAKIESESLEKTGLRSDVIPLYQGGEYWLYRYKKYTDVRLVFAPERQAAFFGGDPDNFTYPRYDIDMALFRVYENGKPVESTNYFKWNAKGAADSELVFVSGNPGLTARLDTLAQIEDQRNDFLPMVLGLLKRRLDVLATYSKQGPEQAREALGMTFGLSNAQKAFQGRYEGLLDKNLITKKQKEEADFRALVDGNPEWKKDYGSAWDDIAQAEKKRLSQLKPSFYRGIGSSRMLQTALTIVQLVAEVKKPDGQRLDGYHESQLESLKFRLFSPAPVYPHLEQALLADGLELSREQLGSDDPFVKATLNGQDPRSVVSQLFTGTRMADPAFRKSLVEGGEAAVAASTDPMIVMARKIDPIMRQTRKWMEDNVESVETAAGEKIGKARFAAYGKSLYPDATFTLRLTFGTVKGYPMNGTEAPPWTTLYGLYDRSYSFSQKPPFDLPARFAERRDRLDLTTRVNFVSTCDIIGGNSGSPVINRNAELVGLIFDGNIESLVGDYVYDETSNRAVAVHTAVMIEALRKLYDAGPLADELEGKN